MFVYKDNNNVRRNPYQHTKHEDCTFKLQEVNTLKAYNRFSVSPRGKLETRYRPIIFQFNMRGVFFVGENYKYTYVEMSKEYFSFFFFFFYFIYDMCLGPVSDIDLFVALTCLRRCLQNITVCITCIISIDYIEVENVESSRS